MPKLQHFDDWGTVRFVTFSCNGRYPLLRDDEVVNILLSQVEWIRFRYEIKFFAYVIMPEHVHLVFCPPEGLKVGKVIGELKSQSAREFVKYWEWTENRVLYKLRARRPNAGNYTVWLPRCDDHNCRNQETVIEKINYCHFNPVKRGLVKRPEDWRWSSYSWYVGMGDSVIEISPIH